MKIEKIICDRCGANEMLEEVIDDIRKYMEEVNADEDKI